MRWLILLLILSSLFISGCFYRETFEKEPALEQYIIIIAEPNNSSLNYNLEENNAKLININ